MPATNWPHLSLIKLTGLHFAMLPTTRNAILWSCG